MANKVALERFIRRINAETYFQINGWFNSHNSLPSRLSTEAFAVALWLSMPRIEKVLDLVQQNWECLGHHHVVTLQEFAKCLREDEEIAGADFLDQMARELAEDTWRQLSPDIGWQKFRKFINEWQPRYLSSLKSSSDKRQVFRALIEAQDLSEFKRVAFGHELEFAEGEWNKRFTECVNKFVHEYEGMDVPAKISLNFQLAVLELDQRDLFKCLAAIVRMPEAAIHGRWTDLFDCVHLGWPLVAYIAVHWETGSKLLERASWHIVDILNKFRESASDKDMRDASLFPMMAFSILAALASLREEKDTNTRAETVEMIRKNASFIDDQTNGKYEFSKWVENHFERLGSV